MAESPTPAAFAALRDAILAEAREGWVPADAPTFEREWMEEKNLRIKAEEERDAARAARNNWVRHYDGLQDLREAWLEEMLKERSAELTQLRSQVATLEADNANTLTHLRAESARLHRARIELAALRPSVASEGEPVAWMTKYGDAIGASVKRAWPDIYFLYDIPLYTRPASGTPVVTEAKPIHDAYREVRNSLNEWAGGINAKDKAYVALTTLYEAALRTERPRE